MREVMPCLDPDKRRTSFEEVATGFTEEQAKKEAERCLQCANPACMGKCPIAVEIPKFIKAIKDGDYEEANRVIKQKNNFPAISSRVCPQESQCEMACICGIQGEPIAIGALERFVSDKFVGGGFEKGGSREKKVAVVGSGPAGLNAAAELAKKGFRVTVFEALHEFGGVLTYGIPEFRVPKDLVRKEIGAIRDLGVEFKEDVVIGKTLTLEDLKKDFDAVFIASGAGVPYFMDIPGVYLKGVYSANEFLTRCNLMKAYKFPEYDTPIKVGKNVAVIGAGNVAIDAARTALRLGAEKVYVVYRRSVEEMPARKAEIEHAEEEGIEFKLLSCPVEILGNDKKDVKAVKCVKMELGEPDEGGRRRPVPIEGSEFEIGVDNVIMALGQGCNRLVQESSDLDTKGNGKIVVGGQQETSVPGVFAGGDVVTGAATVISAMEAGKRAAEAIEEYLNKDSSI